MKRCTTALVAAATALTLVVAPPAYADSPSSLPCAEPLDKQSSELTDEEALAWSNCVESLEGGTGYTSSRYDDDFVDFAQSSGDSSYRNDAVNGWRSGTTLDIIYQVVRVVGGLLGLVVAVGIFASIMPILNPYRQ